MGHGDGHGDRNVPLFLFGRIWEHLYGFSSIGGSRAFSSWFILEYGLILDFTDNSIYCSISINLLKTW
jgi:hypothetical protein